MSGIPLHPAIVHLPLGLAFVMPVIAAMLLAGWWAGWWGRRAWLVAVVLQAVLAASAFVAVRTGESEEERVEDVVPEAALETHEQRAEVFAWFAVATLALALGAAVVPSERTGQIAALGASAATVGATILALAVGHAGGELVYRHGAASAAAEVATARDTFLPQGQEDDD